MSYRWTRHRIVDSHGNDGEGLAPISLWRVAAAAAEETLQGGALVPAWLNLFQSQLSSTDRFWLRWSGDMAESAELRRAYSGLYGRFFARAMLAHHLGLDSFISLGRNGISIPGSIEVIRQSRGDIPDWLAWNNSQSSFILCEAKGSLTAKDFLTSNPPKCVQMGKAQFSRVSSKDSMNGVSIFPDEWVAATSWATDKRGGSPATLLWDPPVERRPFTEEEMIRHRSSIYESWLDSIAPALGAVNKEDLFSASRRNSAVLVTAKPTKKSGEGLSSVVEKDSDGLPSTVKWESNRDRPSLAVSPIYAETNKLDPPRDEYSTHQCEYIAASITAFGLRPVRSKAEFESLQFEREYSEKSGRPAMLVGVPANLTDSTSKSQSEWLGQAGIAKSSSISLFDLQQIDVEQLN